MHIQLLAQRSHIHIQDHNLYRKLAGVFLAATLAVSQATPAHSAKPTIGLSANVLQSQDSASSIGANSSLWFLLKPGASTVRQVSIKSLANIPMLVTPKIGYGVYLNGVAEFDESKKSTAEKWITFSEKSFTLGVGGTHIVSMRMQIPKNEIVGTSLATLFITGAPLTAVKQTAKYAVPTTARIAIPMFVGVGTMAQISTNFVIDGTRIFNEQGGRFASIRIVNKGKTPIAPVGSISIQNTGGDIKVGKPIVLYSKTLIPGEAGLITVRIPSSIPNGRWIFKENLSQGAFAQSKDVKVALTAPSIFTKANLIRLVIFMVSLLLLLFGLRTRKRPAKVKAKAEPLIEAFDIDAFIAELDELDAKNKLRKKAAPKKQVKKAAPAKKKPAKKAAPVRKKAAVKKSSPRR